MEPVEVNGKLFRLVPAEEAGQTAILKKMVAIMAELTYLRKEGTYKDNQKTYTYITDEQMKAAVHDALVKHQVVFVMEAGKPELQEVTVDTNQGPRKRVQQFIPIDYRFMDADTGEMLDGKFGFATHARDEKGYASGLTGAWKYIMHTHFAIPTGDDPEREVNPDDSGPEKPEDKTIESMKNRVEAGAPDKKVEPKKKDGKTPAPGVNTPSQAQVPGQSPGSPLPDSAPEKEDVVRRKVDTILNLVKENEGILTKDFLEVMKENNLLTYTSDYLDSMLDVTKKAIEKAKGAQSVSQTKPQTGATGKAGAKA